MTKQIQTVDEKLKAEISGALARAYCYVENSRKQMDSDLLKAMGRELEPVFFQAQQEAVETVESLRKTDRFPQSLTTFDGKTKTFDRLSDSDISYNKALDDVLEAIQTKGQDD